MYKTQAHETIEMLMNTATYEAKRGIIFDMIELFKDQPSVPSEVINMMEKFRDTIKMPSSETYQTSSDSDGDQKKKMKAKRPPNAYNIFMSDKMKELKATQPEMDNKQLMKLALEAYQLVKQNDKQDGATAKRHRAADPGEDDQLSEALDSMLN